MGQKWINDRVHGGITLYDAEVDILDTPIFQRLRHLKQLSFLHYVFPGGEHSRFQHSLGVLHVMGRMIGKLKHSISDEEERHLRVAALLHDVGHYPFSHLGEFAYAAAQVRGQPVKQSGSDGPSRLIEAMNTVGGAKGLHEKLSRILIENRPDLQQAFSKHRINPKLVISFFQDSPSQRLHLQQMLHSDLDCDRLDYLVRDSTAVGVRYGLVDIDYIIQSLQFADMDDGNKVLAISPKGIPAVEHFLIARFLHYKGVVSHKTVMTFEIVARAILLDMIRNERLSPFDSVEQIENMAANGDDRILQFTDSFFFEKLRQYRDDLRKEGKTGNPEYAYAVCILERIRPRTVFEIQFLETAPPDEYKAAKDLITSKLDLVARTIGVDRNLVGYAETVAKFCDDFDTEKWEEDEGNAFKCVKVDFGGKVVPVQLVSESVLSFLVKHRWKVFRIFYVEPVEGQRPQFEQAKTALTELIRRHAGT